MRLLAFFGFLFVLCASCGRAEGVFDEARIRGHFAANELAFNALAAQAAKFPEIKEASFCPDQACTDRIIKPDDQEFWTSENLIFRSSMEALSYPGYFFWRRRGDGSIEIPNLGSSESDEFWAYYSLVTPASIDETPNCNTMKPNVSVYFSNCYAHLNTTWAIQKSYVSVQVAELCFEAKDACVGKDYNSCVPEQCRL